MSSEKILNVAVLGCGEVAQIVHIPNLVIASDKFKITAVCDISAQSVKLCAERFSIPNQFSSLDDMLSSSIPIDLVLILTADAYHASHIIACADAGKHVMIEKPMAQTLAEYDAVEEARVRNGVVIFVAYMRRYAPALQLLKDEIKGKTIKYVRVRDIIGNNRYFTSQSGMNQRYYRDFPPSASTDMAQRNSSNLKSELGEERAQDPRNAHSWMLLHGLGSHDLSAMRDVLGMPEKCLLASRSDDEGKSLWWNILFQYQGFKTYFEMAIDEVALFDAHIEVYTNDSRVKVQYDTPYVKGLPITVTIRKQLPSGAHSEQVIRPTYLDPYTIELGEVYDAIVHKKEYKTTVTDARHDTELVKMIMDALVD